MQLLKNLRKLHNLMFVQLEKVDTKLDQLKQLLILQTKPKVQQMASVKESTRSNY